VFILKEGAATAPANAHAKTITRQTKLSTLYRLRKIVSHLFQTIMFSSIYMQTLNDSKPNRQAEAELKKSKPNCKIIGEAKKKIN
jgi:hypothetical protein